MKILEFTRLYYPHVGGVEKQVEELNKKLVKKGLRVVVLTEKYDDSLKDMETIDGVSIVRMSYLKIRYFGLINVWVWIFKNRKIITDADIIHTHGVFIWYWPFRFLFPRKPIYTTFHGWEGTYPIPAKNILIRKIAAKLAWKNITIGEFVRKHYGIKSDKTIYTSVDTPLRKEGKKERKRLLYVGRLDKDTGLRRILNSLNYLKGYQIDFCGDGPLADECSKYGKVHGFVDPTPFFEKAEICLSPGHTSILEAFSHKCLVITTYNNPVKKDYLLMTPFAKWMAVEKTPKKMAERIRYYSKHPEEAKPMIEAAYEWVKTQNWEAGVDMYLELWEAK